MSRQTGREEAGKLKRGRVIFWPGFMIGIGLVGTLDEVVLHQLLHWHHLYDRSTPEVGLVSDGIFHVASTVLLVLGVYLMFAGRQHGGKPAARRAWAAVLLGGGAFNLYDGTVQHKLLKLHQVRPGVPTQAPYDVAFIGLSLVLLAGGWWLLRQGRRDP